MSRAGDVAAAHRGRRSRRSVAERLQIVQLTTISFRQKCVVRNGYFWVVPERLLIPVMWALDSSDVGRASERSDAG